MATITVSGYAEVSVAPDEARIDLTVRTIVDTPGEALANISERTRSLVDLLNEPGIPAVKRSATVSVTFEVEPA